MAKLLTSKEFNELVQKLERMADGVAQHKGDEGFANRVDEAQVRGQRKELEDLREEWESLVNKAARAYDAYAAKFAFCSAESAKHTDTVRGFYGKNNPILSDFGVKVLDKLGRRAKKTDKPKS